MVLQDKKQPEFMLTSDVYINRLVNKNKVKQARKHYKDLKPKYQKLSEMYGVPLNYLISFWAVETHFGYNKGKYHLIDGLTKPKLQKPTVRFFKRELHNVLQIMDEHNLSGDKMMGSWAGAMGHFQFMPSTYNHYAVDYDDEVWRTFGIVLMMRLRQRLITYPNSDGKLMSRGDRKFVCRGILTINLSAQKNISRLKNGANSGFLLLTAKS